MRANHIAAEINKSDRYINHKAYHHHLHPMLDRDLPANSMLICISIKSIDPIMSARCRNTHHGLYVLDLVDAPIDMDHLLSDGSDIQSESVIHKLHQLFHPLNTNINSSTFLTSNVDVMLVASTYQQRLYELMFPSFRTIVARHHHTNYCPQLVRDPNCGSSSNAIVIGMEGFTRNNLHAEFVQHVEHHLQDNGFELLVIDHTSLNMEKVEVIEVDASDESSSSVLSSKGCPYVPLTKTTSINHQVATDNDKKSICHPDQHIYHQHSISPNIGLIWPPTNHSSEILDMFGAIKPVTRLLWWWSHATPVVWWCGFESYAEAANAFDYTLSSPNSHRRRRGGSSSRRSDQGKRFPCAWNLKHAMVLLKEMSMMESEEKQRLVQRGLNGAQHHLPIHVAHDLVHEFEMLIQ